MLVSMAKAITIAILSLITRVVTITKNIGFNDQGSHNSYIGFDGQYSYDSHINFNG